MNLPRRQNAVLFRRLFRLVFFLVVLLIVAAGLAEAFVIAYPQLALTIDSGDVKGDVMVVLGGQYQERAPHAEKLYAEHAAPRILISGQDDYLITANWLETHGVPANVITLEPRSRTTYENAEFSVPMLRQMGAKRVIIVTS
jgi:uncharacterized SAM-binding protein YcdF (DUF218 family)